MSVSELCVEISHQNRLHPAAGARGRADSDGGSEAAAAPALPGPAGRAGTGCTAPACGPGWPARPARTAAGQRSLPSESTKTAGKVWAHRPWLRARHPSRGSRRWAARSAAIWAETRMASLSRTWSSRGQQWPACSSCPSSRGGRQSR